MSYTCYTLCCVNGLSMAVPCWAMESCICQYEGLLGWAGLGMHHMQVVPGRVGDGATPTSGDGDADDPGADA